MFYLNADLSARMLEPSFEKCDEVLARKDQNLSKTWRNPQIVHVHLIYNSYALNSGVCGYNTLVHSKEPHLLFEWVITMSICMHTITNHLIHFTLLFEQRNVGVS